MKKYLIYIIIFLVLAGIAGYIQVQSEIKNITSFEECAKKYPVMESYPARCSVPNGPSFTQDIGNELELKDLITIASPRPNQKIVSPLEIRGAARGTWFFEASFPIKLIDTKGNVIAEGHAEATGDWMTEELVPYKAVLKFKTEAKSGTLILEKDNPSGMPENDNQLKVPVKLQ